MKSSETATVTAFPSQPVPRRRQDTSFLPAALEIIETPASPAGRLVGLTIIAFLCLTIVWSIFGKIDIIVTSQGRLIPAGKSKVIQPFEAGVVTAIKVGDGDPVRAGDVLVMLDPTLDQSDEKHAVLAYAQDRLDLLRLKALIDGRTSFAMPGDIDPRMNEVAMSALQAQVAEHDAKVEALRRQSAQKAAEGQEIEAAIAKITSSLPLISEQRDIRNALLANQYGSRLAYLQVQQQVVEAQNELVAQRNRKEENAQAAKALDRERVQVEAAFRKDWLSDLGKAEVLASQHQEDIAKADMRRELRTLRSPVDGTVQQLSVHTLGGIVTPAERLMVIVPRDVQLDIEANLSNRDVGFVHKGQPVQVKIETFDFTRYGLLEGTVTSVSRDAVSTMDDGSDHVGARTQAPPDAAQGDRSGAPPSYVAHIAIAAKGMQTEQGFVPLEPGMAVTAEIMTGRRAVIDFFLSPLRKTYSESLTER